MYVSHCKIVHSSTQSSRSTYFMLIPSFFVQCVCVSVCACMHVCMHVWGQCFKMLCKLLVPPRGDPGWYFAIDCDLLAKINKATITAIR